MIVRRRLLPATLLVLLAGLPASAQAAQLTPICAIQSAGERSPLAPSSGNRSGESVTTTGIVYAREPDGFWIQDSGCDDDEATSNGLFVYTATSNERFPRFPLPEPGDEVEVTGRVSEFFGATQVRADDTRFHEVTVLSRGNPLPEPTVLKRGPYERLEHMRVELRKGRTYVGTNKFGETFLTPGGTGTRVRRTDEAPDVLALDGGLLGGGTVTAFAFDHVSGAVGPLAFTFSNYKLLVVDPDDVEVRGPGRRPVEIRKQPKDTLGVATFNLENVFDADPTNTTGPAVPTISEEEQAIERAKVARSVVDWLGAPAVVAVQEVETRELLEEIADRTNALLRERGREGRYEAVLLEGNDTRGIDVGFLIDASRVDYANVRQLARDAVSDGRCSGGASGELVYDRVPLAVEITPPDGEPLTVVSNHFKSKFGGTEANDFFEPCRVEQAEVLRREVAGLERVVLVGDFNAFRDSPTLDTLTAGAFANTVGAIHPDRRFSYVFQGRVQFLDHVVVSGDLIRDVRAVDSPKIDGDTPFPVFEADPSTAFAVSDHDPLIAYLNAD